MVSHKYVTPVVQKWGQIRFKRCALTTSSRIPWLTLASQSNALPACIALSTARRPVRSHRGSSEPFSPRRAAPAHGPLRRALTALHLLPHSLNPEHRPLYLSSTATISCYPGQGGVSALCSVHSHLRDNLKPSACLLSRLGVDPPSFASCPPVASHTCPTSYLLLWFHPCCDNLKLGGPFSLHSIRCPLPFALHSISCLVHHLVGLPLTFLVFFPLVLPAFDIVLVQN